MSGLIQPRRCSETRAHYAHEWYDPFTVHCPGGPDESAAALRAARDAALAKVARAWDEGYDARGVDIANEGLTCTALTPNPYRAALGERDGEAG